MRLRCRPDPLCFFYRKVERPKVVSYLMDLLIEFLNRELRNYENNIKINVWGTIILCLQNVKEIEEL